MKSRLNLALEIKTLSNHQFEGHGAVFNNVDLGGDVVIAGAFKDSLKEHDAAGSMPQMFWMHRPDKVPGKWLNMEEDKKGLAVTGELADTELGNEMRTLLKMKAVRGLSIGYVTQDYSYDKEGNRLLKQIDLWEVSIVSLAMNPLAQVTAAKSRLSKDGEYVPAVTEFKRDVELSLRDVGLSHSLCKTLVAKLFDGEDLNAMLKSIPLREVGSSDDVDDDFGLILKDLRGMNTRVRSGDVLDSVAAIKSLFK